MITSKFSNFYFNNNQNCFDYFFKNKKKCLKKKRKKMRSHWRLWFRLNYSAESTSLQTDSALRQYSNASVFAHADDVAQCARLQYV